MGAVAGGIIGNQAAQGAYGNALGNQQSALQAYQNLQLPSVASQQLQLQNYNDVGQMTPEQIQALQQSTNAMNGIQTDPRLVQAQMSALSQLSQTGQMGMTPAEQAALTQAQNNAAAQAQAKNAQIMNQFAATGMGGSGAQLAAQLSNSQGAAQQLANNSNQVAQNAQQNALQAISQAGSLGGQMQAQSFGQQAAIAQAQNLINQFNTANAQNVQNQNVQNSNQAQLYNLQQQQNIANQNTGLSNAQQQYNKQLLQQNYQNQLQQAGGEAGQYNNLANTYKQQAGNTANMYAGVGQGIDTGIGAAYGAGMFNSSPTPSGFSEEEQNNWLNSGQMPASNTNYSTTS